MWGHSVINSAVTRPIAFADQQQDFTSTTTTTTTNSATINSTITTTTSTPSTTCTSVVDADSSGSVFPTRESLLAYETAVVIANDMQRLVAEEKAAEALDLMEVATSYFAHVPTCDLQRPHYDFSVRFSAGYVYCSIITVGISLLESQKKYKEANALLRQQLGRTFSPGRRGDWWNRLAVNLHHLRLTEEALAVTEAALQDPAVRTGARLTLEKRLVRLCKPPMRWKVPHKLLYPPLHQGLDSSLTNFRTLTPSIQSPKKVTIRGKLMETGVAGKKNVFQGYDGHPCSVEKFTKQYYSLGQDWEGMHDEGRTMLSIFFLLLWTAMFDSSIPHVFQTPYQSAPLDFGTDCFYGARKSQIDQLVESIEQGNAERILGESWIANYGCQVKCIDWRYLNLDKLCAIVNCIGGLALAKLCRHLAQDFRNMDSGWPDLLLWNPTTEGPQLKLVEVKGPRDRLSEQQRIMIDLLLSCGVPVEICHIVEANAKDKTKYDDEDLYYLLQQTPLP